VPPGASIRRFMDLLTRWPGSARSLAIRKTDRRRWRSRPCIGLEFRSSGGLVHRRKGTEWSASEHAEALYRVGQIMLGLPVDPWPAEALEKAGAAKCTYYFSYYKHVAMAAASDLPLAEPSGEGGGRSVSIANTDGVLASMLSRLRSPRPDPTPPTAAKRHSTTSSSSLPGKR